MAMKPVLLGWEEPVAIQERKKAANRSFGVSQGVALLALITLLFYYVANLAYVGIATMFATFMLHWMLNRYVPHFELCEDGIRYNDGYRRLYCEWHNIEHYAILPLDSDPDLEQIMFKTQKNRRWTFFPLFTFDPQEIDKAKLLRILDENLPRKEFKQIWRETHPLNNSF